MSVAKLSPGGVLAAVVAALLTSLLVLPAATAQENLTVVQVADMTCSVPPDARPESGGESLRHETVTFINAIDEPVSMTGWFFTNAILEDREEPDVFEFPEGFILLPGATVTVHTGVGDDTPTDLFWDREVEAFRLDAGDGVILRDDEGEFVHSQECAAFNFGCPDVTATPLREGALRLDFSFGDETEPDFYHIYRANSPGDTFVKVSSVPGHVSAFIDGTVPKGATVRYIVVGDFGTARGQDCREVEVTSIPFFPNAAVGALAVAGCVAAFVVMRRKA